MTSSVPPPASQALPITTTTDQSGLVIATHPSSEAVPSPSHLRGDGLTTVTSDDPDKRALKQHELALQRLEDIQKDMIGGEKEGKIKFMHTSYV